VSHLSLLFEHHYTGGHFAEGLYAELHYAECLYAECCGAVPEADTVVNSRNEIPLPKQIQ
jgi:hypothetical protein